MKAYIQHYNICNTLLQVEDEHLHSLRDLETEKTTALNKLNINTSEVQGCPDVALEKNFVIRHLTPGPHIHYVGKE